jgi:DNA repair exonuclease SbcCD ATPase subunit
MAWRAKPAAKPVVSLAPPPSPHPPGGYDARTVAEAAEIIRHQSHVLEIRARVATAADGVRPLHVDGAPSVQVAHLGLEAREVELAAATAALREAETTLGRIREELATREAGLSEREARVLEDQQALAGASMELDRDRRALAEREVEVAARDAAVRTEAAQASAAQAHLDRAEAMERESNDTRAELAAEMAQLASRAAELDRREQTLAARTSSVEQAEKDAARRHAELSTRERSLDDSAKELGKREARLEKELAAGLRRRAKEQKRFPRIERKTAVEAPAETPATVAPAPAPQQPEPAGIASFNVETLASLVEQRRQEFPDRADEWHWTLMSLRNVADISGALPRTVDDLVRDVFEPILD